MAGGGEKSDLFLTSVRFLSKKLEEKIVVDGKPVKMVLATGDDFVRSYLKNLEPEKKKGLVAALVMGSITRNRSSYHEILLREGIKVKLDSVGNKSTRLHLRPVTLEMSLKLLTEDYEKVLQAIQSWLLLRPFKFSMRVENVIIDIKATPAEELTPPPRNRDGSDPFGDFYALESTIVMETYMGFTTDHSLVRKVSFNLSGLDEWDSNVREVTFAQFDVDLKELEH